MVGKRLGASRYPETAALRSSERGTLASATASCMRTSNSEKDQKRRRVRFANRVDIRPIPYACFIPMEHYAFWHAYRQVIRNDRQAVFSARCGYIPNWVWRTNRLWRKRYCSARKSVGGTATASALSGCSSDATSVHPVKYMGDTGASFHMRRRKRCPKWLTDKFSCTVDNIRLQTANGVVDIKEAVRLKIGGETLDFLLMDDAPDVLSIGKLVKAGWNFAWTNRKYDQPTLTHPSGRQMRFVVENDVPYWAL